MITSIVTFLMKRRPLVLFMVLCFLGTGYMTFRRLNIEAYPDPSPPIIELIAQPSGQSAEEVERLFTIPIEVQMAGMPGLLFCRSQSLVGLSDIRLQFSYETPYKSALQEVINRLSLLAPLPSGVVPQISPESAVGEIFRYQLSGPPGYSLTELKSLQDWVLTRRFKTVPGVLDVVGWGGTTKEYHAEVSLAKLAAYHLSLPTVLNAIGNSNLNVSGRTIEMGQQEVDVIGVGLIKTVEDIKDIVLATYNGTPVYVKDVAEVSIGFAPRLGIAGRDQENDIVQGVVLMRQYEKTREVIQGVKAELEKINSTGILPPGVKLKTIYDRNSLISVTTHTVVHNLLVGVLLVFLIQWIFLGDLRSAIVVSATIPFALFFSAMVMYLSGESANLLSVGSVDFGIIVDATVVVVENIFRYLCDAQKRPGGLRGRYTGIVVAMKEISTSVCFSTAIIVAAFLPLFTMSGVEGRIFSPMAKTYGYALVGALLATFVVAPVLSAYLLPKTFAEHDPIVLRLLKPIYAAVLAQALRLRLVTLGAAAVLIGICAWILPNLGAEFLPKLEEGNLWIRADMPPTINLAAGQPLVQRMRAIILGHPEVLTVVSQHGRPDDGSDPSGSFNAEFFAPLKPFDEWPKGYTKAMLVADLGKEMDAEFPGVTMNFSQYIEDNVEEALSGVKGENSIKIFGKDLAVLEKKADAIATVMAKVPGVEDVGIFHELGRPTLKITVDRHRCARYGLAPGDVNAVVQAAVAGNPITSVFEGEQLYNLVVRATPEYRDDIARISAIPVVSPSGAYVPLSELCEIRMEDGASYVYRENYERYLPIKFSVKGRDLGTTISELQTRLKETVSLDTGYHLEWSGEYGELIEAIDRLEIIIPISFLLIVVLLYAAFNSLRDSLIVLVGIPLTAVGGIIALWLTGTVFSVSAAVGFISLLGVAVMAGTIILSPYNAMVDEGMLPVQAVQEVAVMRMRPVLMMCLSACIGLLPAAMSTAIGSETQRPLAVVIVGGMFLAPFLILLVMPVVISLIGHRGRMSGPSESGEWIEEGDEEEPGPAPLPHPSAPAPAPSPASPDDTRGAHAP